MCALEPKVVMNIIQPRKNRTSTDHITYPKLNTIPPHYVIDRIKNGTLYGVQEGDTWYVIEEEYRPTPKVQIADIKIPFGSLVVLSLQTFVISIAFSIAVRLVFLTSQSGR
ncbi:MAG: hypothetical protein HOL49_02555 [Gammaproteobacteria bacterium]|nr:hypothetical protein [Gammaproteobacteria bacterium]